jgi:hypothetical protein
MAGYSRKALVSFITVEREQQQQASKLAGLEKHLGLRV